MGKTRFCGRSQASYNICDTISVSSWVKVKSAPRIWLEKQVPPWPRGRGILHQLPTFMRKSSQIKSRTDTCARLCMLSGKLINTRWVEIWLSNTVKHPIHTRSPMHAHTKFVYVSSSVTPPLILPWSIKEFCICAFLILGISPNLFMRLWLTNQTLPTQHSHQCISLQ